MAKRVMGAGGRGTPKATRAQRLPGKTTPKAARGTRRLSPVGQDLAADLQNFFGANLRTARIKLGMTQAELGEKSGLGTQYISKVENGHKNLTLSTMATLAVLVRGDLNRMLRPPR